MTTKDGGQQMAVGDCPEHGPITDEALDYRFPQPSVCELCGQEVEKVVIADATEVAQYV